MISIPPRPYDTSREADDLQFKIVREMSFEKRWRILFDFIESGMRTLDDGIRYRHPEYSYEEVRLASIRARLGDALFMKVYPNEKFVAL
jgi:hypothetical protein